MTFVPKSYEIKPSHWTRSVYHVEKLDSVVYLLGRERGLWSWLLHKTSPWEAVLVLDESSCWHNLAWYALWMWNYPQVSYILLRHTYIANTRNDTTASGTSGDFDKRNSLYKFTYSEWCGSPLLPTRVHTHTHTHARTHNAHAHTCTYTQHTHIHMHVHTMHTHTHDETSS